MAKTLDDVIDDVRGQCDAVLHRLGLAGPTVNQANTYFILGYFGDAVGLEILVEFDYFFVYFLPFRQQVEGVVPVGYRDPSDQIQKMYLQEAMEKLGLSDDKEIADLKRLGGDYRHCAAMLTILLQLTQTAWPMIVERNEHLFPRDRGP
jgi:hypothetical protein